MENNEYRIQVQVESSLKIESKLGWPVNTVHTSYLPYTYLSIDKGQVLALLTKLLSIQIASTFATTPTSIL